VVAVLFFAQSAGDRGGWSSSPSCLISTCWEAIFFSPLREVCQDAHH